VSRQATNDGKVQRVVDQRLTGCLPSAVIVRATSMIKELCPPALDHQ